MMIHELLRHKKIILASVSPRRKELFSLLGISFEAIPADIEEYINSEAPQTQAMQNALRKAQFVKDKVDKDALVVSADTIVVLDNHILGKTFFGK